MIGVPDKIASVELSPHPSFEPILTTTSATLYIALRSCALNFCSEKITLHLDANVFQTALKSVPFSSTGCVCITNATLLCCSAGNVSTNVLNAKITSPGCFLLMFLLFQNTTKSTPFASLICFFIEMNVASDEASGLNML